MPLQPDKLADALEKFERVIRLADTLASDVPITSAARQHITSAYAALADMLALASSVPEDLIQSSEREMIVAYLRSKGGAHTMADAAAIERGEHLPSPPEVPQEDAR